MDRVFKIDSKVVVVVVVVVVCVFYTERPRLANNMFFPEISSLRLI